MISKAYLHIPTHSYVLNLFQDTNSDVMTYLGTYAADGGSIKQVKAR